MVKKRFVVDKEINGVLKSIVVEAEKVYEAMHADSFEQFFTDEGLKEVKDNDVAIVGAYEVCSINHLEGIDKINQVHSFYQKKIKELGYNPMTFEKEKESSGV